MKTASPHPKSFLERFQIKLPPVLIVILDAVKVFLHTHGTIRAASLSYTSLLAVVPLVILLTSISMALGMADLLTDHLPAFNATFNLSLPLDEILPILENAQQIKLGRLGLIGSIGLFVTFIFAMDAIETNMNIVWQVHKNRSYLRKAAIYAPFLMVWAGIIGAFTAIINYFREGLEILLVENLSFLIGDYARYFFNGGFTLAIAGIILGVLWVLYYYMPYTHVKPKPALYAALSTAFALYIFITIMIFIQASMFERMSLFYGSLAFVPLVMFLFYGIWAIILFGNALCWRIQNNDINKPFETLHL